MPLRTIRVTTREELAAALQTADRVVVEGDDALLSYAIAQASGDPGHRIDVELASPLAPAPAFIALSGDSAMQPAARPPPAPAAARPLGPTPSAPSRRRGVVWFVIAALILALAAALATFTHFTQHVQRPLAPEQAAQPSLANPPSAVAPAPQPALVPTPPTAPAAAAPPQAVVSPKSAAPAFGNVEMIQAIAWPAVAIIAIMALALIARQAIATGRNVEFSWKVTEKVSGRLVITKVKDPSPRRGRAVPA